MWFNIVQNGFNRGQGVTGISTGAVGSIFAIIRCYPGSHIWVKQSGAGPYTQAMWKHHSQFGGFKIAM